jgi:hypothetical protein
MAELRIKRGSLLIQVIDQFNGAEDCVFATTLRPGKETTPIDTITFHGWRPDLDLQKSEDGRGWTLRLRQEEVGPPRES